MKETKHKTNVKENTELDPFLEKYLYYHRFIMQIMGIWPFSATKTEYYLKTLMSIIYDIINLFVAWGEISQALQFVDVINFTESILLAGTSIMLAIKNLVFLTRRRGLQNIILKINDLYINTPKVSSSDLEKTVKKIQDQSVSMTKFCIVVSVTVFLIYECTPVYKNLVTGENVLPYPSLFPFDINDWRIFWPLYIAEAITGFRVIICFVGDTLFFALMYFICTRFDLLLESFEQSIEEAKINNKSTKLFGDCVKYQQKLYRTCDAMKDFYGPIILNQYGFCTLVVCLLCFLCAQMRDPGKIVQFVAYDMAITVQLLLYCYSAQKLETKREWFSNEMFSLPWYNTPNSYQLDYKFALMRSFADPVFLVFGLMPCNMAVFHAIMKTSLSYYTVLVSMKDEETK